MNASPFHVTEITSVADGTNPGQTCGGMYAGDEQPLRDMAASLGRVSLQPLALGWLFASSRSCNGKQSTAADPHAFTEMSTCSIAEWPDF